MDTIPRTPIDWKRYDEHVAQGGTDTAFAQSIGLTANNFAQYKRRHRRQHPTIVDVPLETVDLTPTDTGSPQSEPTSEPVEETQTIKTVHSGSPGSPIMALQPMEYRGELGSPGGLPDIARQTDLDNLKMRVDVLEAFIAKLHQPSTYLPGSPNGSPGSPTHKRGFVMADDLFEAIHTYATAHHLQVKDVVDLGLRRFFAQVGQEVHGDD